MLPGTRAIELLTPGETTVFDRSRCLRHRFSPSTCRLCLAACPHGAIQWDAASGLRRDGRLCRGCMLCAAVCPSGAFAPGEVSLVAVLRQLSEADQPLLACLAKPETQGHARLPCLGLLADPELLLACLLLLDKPLVVNLSGCANCVNQAICEPVSDSLARIKSLGLEKLPDVRLVHSADELTFQESGLSRRALFTLFRRKTRQGAATMLDRFQGSTARTFGDKCLPKGRAFLLHVLGQLPDQSLVDGIKTAFPQLRFNSACTGCTGCVGICPTGALMAPETLGQQPGFIADFCTDCQLCQDFCRQSAIAST